MCDVTDVGDVSFTEHLCSGYGLGPGLGITQKMVDGDGIEYADTLDCLPRNPNRPIELKLLRDQCGL